MHGSDGSHFLSDVVEVERKGGKKERRVNLLMRILTDFQCPPHQRFRVLPARTLRMETLLPTNQCKISLRANVSDPNLAPTRPRPKPLPPVAAIHGHHLSLRHSWSYRSI
ncbi:hypothetical protein GBA52_024389 [Prunus armeniaca]|nr:hypothetical protein GBA52_024389 [Prunus armeniaca]